VLVEHVSANESLLAGRDEMDHRGGTMPIDFNLASGITHPETASESSCWRGHIWTLRQSAGT
jgi:hypothetical protein